MTAATLAGLLVLMPYAILDAAGALSLRIKETR
jgi:hypothetical protein